MENFIGWNQQRKEIRVNHTNMSILETVLLGGRECYVKRTKEVPILKEEEEEKIALGAKSIVKYKNERVSRSCRAFYDRLTRNSEREIGAKTHLLETLPQAPTQGAHFPLPKIVG